MSGIHDDFGDLLVIPARDRLDDLAQASATGYEALLLLFEQTGAATAYAPISGDAVLAPRAEALVPLVAPAYVPSDPNIGSQWHLLNTGQFGGTPGIDINVTRAWDDYSGQGVRVGVVDDGVEYTHPDLLGTYDTTTDWDPASNDSNAFPGSSDRHGTAVAGLIGADNDNGLGGVGVAYDSTLTGYRIFGGSVTFSEFKAIFDRHVSDNLDLSNNSWTFTGQFADNFLVSGFSSIGAGIDNAVTNGRGGLGSVILFAAGNGRLDGDSSDYHNMQNSRETISVAAVDNTGNVSWYSNPGASLLIATPSNGGTAGIYTTDRTGSLGYSSGDYTGSFGGTSAATPITAGVVALMLEANPNLGYRDVQEILAYSARLVDAGDPGWAWNGADNWNGGGLHTSHDYGFGLTDATAAVRLAETWSLQSTRANEATLGGSSNTSAAIPDGGAFSDFITLSSGLEIDHVEVVLNVAHNNIGDLVVKLLSPEGTESVIVNRPGKDPGSSSDPGSTANNINFTFDSTNHWGETGVGTWTLTLEDHRAGTVGTLLNWSLNLYGDTASDDDLYVYTDEYGNFTGAGDASRRLLEDSSGTDRLNAAAVTSDITLDLTPGAGGTLAGNSLTIGAGTVIEEIVLGDGDDSLTGNAADNLLWGGRGDDDLDGGAGFDLALYAYAVADYTITYVDAVSVTIDYIGAGSMDEGLDSVTNVESFSFDGAVYAFAELVGGDPPPPPDTFFAIAATDAVKAEGDAGTSQYTFTVTRSGDLFGADQVDWAVAGSGSDPADAADFGGSLPSGTIFFAIGETSQVVTVDVSGDSDVEVDEGFTVTLSNPSAGSQITTPTADGTIQNDDPAPPATFFAIAATDAVKAEGDAGTTSYSFTVTRSGVLSGADQVDFAVSSVEADAADFGGSLPGGTVSFAIGETTQVVTIDVTGDSDFETDEDFAVTLSNASAGTEITTASADGTIQNDDPHASFAIAPTDAIKDEGDASTTSYSFTVTRSGILSNADSVDWAVAGSGVDPADAADFGGSFPSGTAHFAPGETTQIVTVDVTGDTTFEADEGFTVALSNASAGTVIATASAAGTILNDDPAPADILLSLGQLETGQYGNNYNGQVEPDGEVTAFFAGTGNDLILSLTGFDVDVADEVEVLLNGDRLGFLDAGPDEQLNGGNSFLITAAEQAADNVITFKQFYDPIFKWGVTNILLEEAPPPPPADIVLAIGEPETGEYGNNYNGQFDADGLITASFAGTGSDLILSLDGFDVDVADEVEVLLNGVRLGFLDAGPDEQLNGGNSFLITAAQQGTDNVITFKQFYDPIFKWGVTNILLEEAPPPPPADIALAVGEPETGEYGNNYNGQFDADGLITASFAGTGNDLILSLTGFDVDVADEVEVLLNGDRLGFLDAGPDEQLNGGNSFLITAAQQAADNVITFKQFYDPIFKWGVTNILLEEAPPPPPADIALAIGELESGEYGNNYNGQFDADGLITASFTGTGNDLILSLTGFDVDVADEIEVLLNGVRLGFLDAGPDEQLNGGNSFLITAAQQAADNVLTFKQFYDPIFKWGVTNILLDDAAPAASEAAAQNDTLALADVLDVTGSTIAEPAGQAGDVAGILETSSHDSLDSLAVELLVTA